ncbi:MAG: integrase arm-type DNA-binding domain-containing protein [Dechloromonas sp.]|nr:integrase arm-type DNA-binding domain-containing protein [Dechloromonas sp.]
MPRKAKELSALEVNRLTAPGLHAVGGVAGLYLQVTDSGARSWILRATVGTRRRDIGLGGFPDVTLAGAREAARAGRLKIKDGIDPVEEAKAKRSALAASQAAAITFGDAAAKYIAAHESGWKSTKHAAQWTSTLETYAHPIIGKIRVSEIETAHIITILESIWTTKTETASRLRGRIESVLDWATVRGYRKGENPARWKGHLDMILPARAKVQKVEHHAAIDYREIGAFMVKLAKFDGMGARALEFAILAAARSGEVRGATWSEIDEKAAVWTIPAGRMKAEKEHRIPLSPPALALLRKLPRITGTDLVFPNNKEMPTVLSDMTLTSVLRRMGQTVTVHGFRSTFRDWAGEMTAYPREVIEHALAHQLKDKAEAAYARGTLFDKRRRLMVDWARYCATSAANKVTPIRGRAIA